MSDISQYKVGVVLSFEGCGGKSKSGKALKACTVDIGGDEPVTIVTSASNVREKSRVVVAPVGSTFTNAEGEEETVKKATVGGVASEGMLCDSRMLGWSGGGVGVAAQLPDSFDVGTAPPSSKPRGGPQSDHQTEGGEMAAAAAASTPAPGLFEKKLTKEEKKRLAEEKRKARKAAKEAKAKAKEETQ